MRRNETAGLLFALAGFSMLSLGDAVVKSMAGAWPTPAMAAVRYVIGAAGLAGLLWHREGRAAFAIPQPRAQLWRGGAVALATIAFFSAMAVLPMAAATALTFTSPMITALLAALLLGEPARRETWIASLLAFAGVLVVLRPNVMAVGWAALLPLGAALGMSLLMIGNRRVAGKASPLAMQYYAAVMAMPLLVLAALAFAASGMPRFAASWPDWTIVVRCTVVALLASTAHWLLYLATTRAGAASIAPMTYVQLLWSCFFGWLWFNTPPDLATLGGAAVIIGAGLYLWQAGRRRDAGQVFAPGEIAAKPAVHSPPAKDPS